MAGPKRWPPWWFLDRSGDFWGPLGHHFYSFSGCIPSFFSLRDGEIHIGHQYWDLNIQYQYSNNVRTSFESNVSIERNHNIWDSGLLIDLRCALRLLDVGSALPDFSEQPGKKGTIGPRSGHRLDSGSKLFKQIPNHFCPLDELGIMVLNKISACWWFAILGVIKMTFSSGPAISNCQPKPSLNDNWLTKMG